MATGVIGVSSRDVMEEFIPFHTTGLEKGMDIDVTSTAQALLDDHIVLRRLWFNINPHNPFDATTRPSVQPELNNSRRRFLLGIHTDSTRVSGCKRNQILGMSARHFPLQLMSAARLGNVSAAGVVAQLLEVAGQLVEAHRWWKKAAKLGDLEGLIKTGLATYRGSDGDV